MYAFYSSSDGYKKGNLYGEIAGDGTDKRTIEHYRTYKEAGFNTILLENECKYTGETFATSDLKMVMDIAQELSLKVIVFDSRINVLSNTEGGIVGDGKTYTDEAALETQLASYIAPYKEHPAFYGLYLMDEPNYEQLETVSQLTRALLSIDENIYIHCCLFPYRANREYLGGKFYENRATYYARYLERWFASGIKYVNYDDYMFLLDDNQNATTNDTWMTGMDVVVETAKKYGATFGPTIQSFSAYNATSNAGYRPVTEADLRWQAYYALGHGATNLSYYHYWSDPYSYNEDSTCFVDVNGNKKDLYTAGQRVNEEINRLAPVILSYEYLGTQYFTNRTSTPSYYSSITNYSIDKIGVSDELSGDLMICEMQEKGGEHFGYMLLNSADPSENKNVLATVEFKGYETAKVYKKGLGNEQKLVNGQLTVELTPGEGIFVVPVK